MYKYNCTNMKNLLICIYKYSYICKYALYKNSFNSVYPCFREI